MTVVCYPLDAVGGSPEYTGRDLRDTIAALLGGASSSRPLGAFSGVRPGTPSTTVTLSGLTWTCKPHAGVLDEQAAAEAGPYLYAVVASETGSLDAQAVGNARTDLLVAQVSDPAESDGTSVPEVEIVYVAGTAGPGAPAPDVPDRSMVLARFNVPASGGGSPTVTWVAPTLFAAGARASVSTVADLSLLSAYSGMEATVEATPGAFWRHNGTSWVMYGVAVFSSASARDAAITSPQAGMLARTSDTGIVWERIGSTWTPVPGGRMPYVEYRLASAQSIGNSADTTINWDNSPEKLLDSWPEATGVITVPYSGWYDIDVLMYWASSATGVRGIHVTRNGTTDRIAGADASAAVTQISAVRRQVYLDAGDTVRVRVFQSSGGSLNVGEYYASGTKTPGLTIRYLGPR